jgi:Domain of unknown function (DUF4400)
MASSKSALEHSMIVRQWTWPFRTVFWWVVIAAACWAFAVGAQWLWALRQLRADPVAHVQQVLDHDVEAMAGLAPSFFAPKAVALWIGGGIRDSALAVSVGFARVVVNWPITARQKVAAAYPDHPLAATISVGPTSNDPGLDQVMQELSAPTGNWALLLTATYVFAVRTAIYICALPLLLLLSAVATVDGLVARAKRRACAGRESASLYHRAKLGLSFVGITGYIVCLGLPSFDKPAQLLVPVAITMAVLLRMQCAYYKKYL